MGHQNVKKTLYILKPYTKLSLPKKNWQHNTLGENLRGWAGGGGGGGGCLCHIPLHHHPTPDTQT